jgi:branched-chain amino acid transport system permease protein
MSFALIQFINFTVIYILLSWAIYLPYRCGQLYLAPVYTMAAGAYFAAYAATSWNWPIFLALIGAPFVGALFAFIPAQGLKRAPGFTTAVVSLGLIFVLQTIIQNLKFLGGIAGYFGIPMMEMPLLTSMITLIVSAILVYRLDHSRIGRAAELIYYNREGAECFGINTGHISIFLQIVSGALGAVAGALFAFTLGTITPDNFGFQLLLITFPIVFIGGNFTMWGVLIFTPILWGLPLILPEAVAQWKDYIYGGLLIVVLIVRPEGVIGKKTVRKTTQFFCRHFNRRRGHAC